MAAYAALVSVMQIIDNLRLHPRPPISLRKKQSDSLIAKITSLQEFLEGYNPHLGYTTEADPLETRIADAAYAAEDVIESHIVDRITNDGEEKKDVKNERDEILMESKGQSSQQPHLDSNGVYQALEKVIEEMALIEKDAMEIEKTTLGVQHQLHKESTPPNSLRSSYSATAQNKSRMVGADDVLLEMKDKLTSHRRDLQIIPIVGMGGTGKTTLAINIYQDRLIKEHFDICAWATISQEYSIQEILEQVLKQLNVGLGEHELGDKLYKHLYGKRYMIVMDDMWTIEAWDGVRRFLPDNENGSRIVVTTRLSNLGSVLSNSNNLEMKLLDEASSWDLLSKTVFGEESCPVELEEIGKEIGKCCKGLPLSIVVVGGLLAKSEHTREFWEYIEENLSRIVNSEDDEHCLRILHLSYKQLPVYLKPCFLYMGIYPEDELIHIPKLTMLWIAEGFLKPIIGKSLEEVAQMYLKDLTDRNLVLIHKVGISGNIKQCKIHDLLRDLCLREAEKERLYTVVAGQSKTTPQGIVNGQRRIVISSTTSKNVAINVVSFGSLVRSLNWCLDDIELTSLGRSRFLRVLETCRMPTNEDAKFERSLHQLVNSRLLDIRYVALKFKLPCSSWPFLQTLIVARVSTPINIWCMPQIRCVRIPNFVLRDPPSDQDDVVLGNLQVLVRIMNFNFSEQVVVRIPNIKKLYIAYEERVDDDRYGLTNLGYLHKLESLDCRFYGETTNGSLHSRINFPHSLKKLTLYIRPSECWEDILDKIGALPNLQKLTLASGSFKEGHWETTEGQFRSLKFLVIHMCEDLQVWKTESSHFPCLEHLLLYNVHKLEEIPLEFADISTLRVLDVRWCSNLAVESAKRIVDEQEELFGEEAALQVQVKLWGMNEALESLASPNFRVERR